MPALERSRRNVPVFLAVQTSCLTCGKDVMDPLQLETLGRFCSVRCFHARELPMRRHQAG